MWPSEIRVEHLLFRGTKRPRTLDLIVCHGDAHARVDGWEGAHTMDIDARAKPSFVHDISTGFKSDAFNHAYDRVMLKHCNAHAFFHNIPKDDFKEGEQMVLQPNPAAWRNVSMLLKPGGTLTIYYLDEMYGMYDERADYQSLCDVINAACDTEFVDLVVDGDEFVIWQKECADDATCYSPS